MNTRPLPGITHWCLSCKTHHMHQRVRHCIPHPTPFEEEFELLVCPYCSSSDVEELQDAPLHLTHPNEARHYSVVFRIPAAREAAQQFLHDLGTQFPGDQAQIVAIQMGHVLATEESGL